ncbi:MAG TPA: glycoside hydrolase family 16 protein [Polyangiaceae bacterium]|nr:glycoside hydrolase family 16 protein [Polyangiaceae bacterium]
MTRSRTPSRRKGQGALGRGAWFGAVLLGAIAAACGADGDDTHGGTAGTGATGGGGSRSHDAAGENGGSSGSDDGGHDAARGGAGMAGGGGSAGSSGKSGAAGAGGINEGGVDAREGIPPGSGGGTVDAATDGAGGSTGGGAEAGDAGGIVPPDGYNLVWNDEFDIDGRPNAANWKYENGFVRNEELQWYQADNASVQGGLLIIEGRKERVTNPNYRAGSTDWKTSRQYAEYTSASLLTSGLHSWQFGRLEMRGRIVAKAGLWPAWWTLGTSGEWPANGEVDIMEFYNGKVLANVACGTTTRWIAKWDSVTKDVSSFGDPAWDTKFHLWRMDWDDQKIDLYLDGQIMNTSDLASMLNPDGQSPFRRPHYMILNLAIGGLNGGDPAATPFPTRYEVDYVRVFQKK